MKESYHKRTGLKEGLRTRSAPVDDKSRPPIGSKYPSVDSNPNRKEPSKEEPTIGPRTA
ncbi:MAG: hypothetical protein KGI08_10450 [Thaumarchaeota archaeon]|nr:hypothetical protein [Nitrososphaerota archaeon]